MTVTDNESSAAESVSVDDGVLRIAVSTAGAGNSLDIENVTYGAEALAEVAAGRTDVGSVLLVGEGANFCAGGNVRDMAAAEDRGAFLREIADAFHAFVRGLDSVSVPIVAGIQGWAAGAGMSIVCHTDVAIGGKSTKMRPAYPALAFTPDGGLTWALPRIVGNKRARDILLTDSIIGGEEAVRLGLLSRLVGDDVIVSEAERVARTLAHGPVDMFRATKALLATSETATLAEQLDAEAASISARSETANGREGVDAFTQKRRPEFT